MFDITRKFVRITDTLHDGMVGFEFAIGEPALFVELMMPEAAFQQFCAVNQVTVLEPAAEHKLLAPDSASSDWDWRLRQATHQRFKS